MKNYKNMKPQFDYQELIDELKSEVRAGSLTENDIIQVLRSHKADKNGYYPIIDWHYNKETMEMELAPDSLDDEEDIREKNIIREQYLEDLPVLKDMTVKACLAEMFEKSK
ncbi:hypothetical protein SAMN02745751_00211 [Dethiosulfatibacter aminovorans DSM 17477]|uniref:Uncharacterized protein n=1 Tax=Dethiosulfatibacter aminovorans DSM 17477 TaxID=1121476 RepID=A0A1M6AQB8_9FIRM|nr:hypothetical protein [Dethiosulfatibacter aminovorans]SHI38719.1 hypothetical protein SAMN02745751_00211 [Dethiosulfatibacter aminovorans DSM 17477]